MAATELDYGKSPSPVKFISFKDAAPAAEKPMHTPGRALTRDEKREQRRRGNEGVSLSPPPLNFFNSQQPPSHLPPHTQSNGVVGGPSKQQRLPVIARSPPKKAVSGPFSSPKKSRLPQPTKRSFEAIEGEGIERVAKEVEGERTQAVTKIRKLKPVAEDLAAVSDRDDQEDEMVEEEVVEEEVLEKVVERVKAKKRRTAVEPVPEETEQEAPPTKSKKKAFAREERDESKSSNSSTRRAAVEEDAPRPAKARKPKRPPTPTEPAEEEEDTAVEVVPPKPKRKKPAPAVAPDNDDEPPPPKAKRKKAKAMDETEPVKAKAKRKNADKDDNVEPAAPKANRKKPIPTPADDNELATKPKRKKAAAATAKKQADTLTEISTSRRRKDDASDATDYDALPAPAKKRSKKADESTESKRSKGKGRAVEEVDEPDADETETMQGGTLAAFVWKQLFEASVDLDLAESDNPGVGKFIELGGQHFTQLSLLSRARTVRTARQGRIELHQGLSATAKRKTATEDEAWSRSRARSAVLREAHMSLTEHGASEDADEPTPLDLIAALRSKIDENAR